jgi:MFS family permease
VLIPLYGSDVLGLDVSQIGWISTFASAVDMLLFYPVGMIMDRWGRKYAIVPSFLVQGVGLALIPLTGGIVGLGAVAGMIGFGNGLGSGTMMTLGADLAPEDARGEFLGMWRLIGDLGFMLGPSVAGAVAGTLALPAAALVMGGSGLVASMIFLFLVPETVKK